MSASTGASESLKVTIRSAVVDGYQLPDEQAITVEIDSAGRPDVWLTQLGAPQSVAAEVRAWMPCRPISRKHTIEGIDAETGQRVSYTDRALTWPDEVTEP